MEGRSRIWLNLFQNLIKTIMTLTLLLLQACSRFKVSWQTGHSQRQWLTLCSEGDFENQRNTVWNYEEESSACGFQSWPSRVFTACFLDILSSQGELGRAGSCLLQHKPGAKLQPLGLHSSLGRGAFSSPCPGGKHTTSPPELQRSRDCTRNLGLLDTWWDVNPTVRCFAFLLPAGRKQDRMLIAKSLSENLCSRMLLLPFVLSRHQSEFVRFAGFSKKTIWN